MADNTTPAEADNERADTRAISQEDAQSRSSQGEVPEHFRKELEEARREAARYRTERNELRKDAEAWREKQDAEKTDLQRAEEALAKRSDELKALEAENTRLRMAATYGIAPENLDLLGAGSADDIEARAKRIAELQKGRGTPAVEYSGGTARRLDWRADRAPV